MDMADSLFPTNVPTPNHALPFMLGYSWRGGLKLSEFNRYCMASGHSGMEVRTHFSMDGAFWKNTRAYAYASFYDKALARKPQSYELSQREADTVLTASSPYSVAAMTNFAERGLEPMSLQKIDKVVCLVLKQMAPYAGGIIRRKLSFLIQYFGVDRHEIEASMMQNTIETLYRYYPEWRSLDDLMAISNRNLSNHAMNIIKFYTAEKRTPYAKVKGRIKIVKPDFAYSDAGDAASQLGGLQQASRDHEVLEAKISIRQLLRHPGLQETHRKFLSLLMGDQDDAFSAWLGQSNSAWADEHGTEKLVPTIAEYMRLNPTTCMAFLSELRWLLS